MKKILVFGAGKSATVLIDYLITTARENDWKVIVADASYEQALAKTSHSPLAEAVLADIHNDQQRAELIKQAAIVISMMPPALHFLIAKDCVLFSKNLLTASYLDDSIRSLEPEILEKGLLFICEMGLDPGIDHMSAMRIIDDIHAKGGSVKSFRSHCGGLIAPESDNNPWHYKISWNPRNVVMAGKAGAIYKMDNQVKELAYANIFGHCAEVAIDKIGKLAIYPNRDSLGYIPVYKLETAETFLRTTLRYPAFCIGWNAIVQAGLADDASILHMEQLNYETWSAPIQPFVTNENKFLLEYLGLFDKTLVPVTAKTSADILQYLLETKLAMATTDHDMIVMLHEIDYMLNDQLTEIKSSLVVKGENNLHTAMAKTVGLPLGIAAKLILKHELKLTGLHIPVLAEIYEPVLKALEEMGIGFTETISQG